MLLKLAKLVGIEPEIALPIVLFDLDELTLLFSGVIVLELTVLELTVLELTVLELTVLELTVLELTVLELTVLELKAVVLNI